MAGSDPERGLSWYDVLGVVVRLTEHPMPVEGLVVDQSPLPKATMRRGAPLTVQVWHPPARSPGYSR